MLTTVPASNGEGAPEVPGRTPRALRRSISPKDMSKSRSSLETRLGRVSALCTAARLFLQLESVHVPPFVSIVIGVQCTPTAAPWEKRVHLLKKLFKHSKKNKVANWHTDAFHSRVKKHWGPRLALSALPKARSFRNLTSRPRVTKY